MAIDLSQAVHYKIHVDGTTETFSGQATIQGVIREWLTISRDANVIWRGKGAKNITIQISNLPIKDASELTKVDELAAGLEFDMTMEEWEAQQAQRLSEGEPVYANLADDPLMVRLIHVNQTKSGFESSLPSEIQDLLNHAKTNYPAWFNNVFQRKYIP